MTNIVSLFVQLCCNQNDMLDYRSSAVLQSKVIICKFPSSWRQIFEKPQRVKFLRIEIFYDCVSLKDIELNRTMESFPSINLQSVAG